MNLIKHYFYDKHIIKYPTIKMWLNIYKPLFELGFNYYFRKEHKPKHHRRRSIAKRDLCRLMRGRIIDYYEHKNRKLHRVTMIPNPTWEWYLSARACISRRKYYGQ